VDSGVFLILGVCGSSGAWVTEWPEGKHHPEDRRQGDSREIAGNDGRSNFPEAENGVRAEPQRRGGPQPNATLRSDHTVAESYAEEKLNYPDIALKEGQRVRRSRAARLDRNGPVAEARNLT
jgi:hypothetical protein